MLIEITSDLWIDTNSIYLVQPDDYNADEILVYINQHPKIPIVVKGLAEIQKLTDKLRTYQDEQSSPSKDVEATSRSERRDAANFLL